MINTGKNFELDPETISALDSLSSGFEFYLPDEKISQVWQETELISTGYPEFEAVYFERELEDGSVFISSDLEFFPAYMLHLARQYGAPIICLEGTFAGSDLINLPPGAYVLVVGFVMKGKEDQVEKILPPLDDPANLDILDLKIMADPYLQEIM